jgi:hypothetical protein
VLFFLDYRASMTYVFVPSSHVNIINFYHAWKVLPKLPKLIYFSGPNEIPILSGPNFNIS